MVNDPVGDMLIQIKNGALARKLAVDLPYSKLKMALGKLLVEEGYATSVVKVGDDPKAHIHIEIKYVDGIPVIGGVKRISKPGLRQYVNTSKIPTVVGGMGIAVLSTPQGIMTGKTARKKGIGGELLCKIW